MKDMAFGEMFSNNVSDRVGVSCLPRGKEWHLSCEDAMVTIHYNDKLVLNMEHAIQTMEGDSVTAPINTNQLSLEGRLHWAMNTRNDSKRLRTAARNHDWEHLDDVKIPSKT